MSTEEQPVQVPLVEWLRSVPKDWGEMREVGHCHHRNVPYGHMMHESADEIERLTAANAKLEQELKDARERVAQATRTNQLHWLDEYNKVNTTLAKVMTTLGET